MYYILFAAAAILLPLGSLTSINKSKIRFKRLGRVPLLPPQRDLPFHCPDLLNRLGENNHV
jgi:hypothetical protein